MPITPTGAPAWVRTTSFSDYGGHLDKHDYMGVGSVNSETDVAAAEFSRMVSDVAACARTASMWVITFLCNDTVPAAPTVEVVLGMTGVRLTSYAGDAPPTGFPSATRVTNGAVQFTFASSYSDDTGTAGAYEVVGAVGSAEATSAVHRAVTCVTTATTVTVRVYDDAGSAVLDPRVTIEVT